MTIGLLWLHYIYTQTEHTHLHTLYPLLLLEQAHDSSSTYYYHIFRFINMHECLHTSLFNEGPLRRHQFDCSNYALVGPYQLAHSSLLYKSVSSTFFPFILSTCLSHWSTVLSMSLNLLPRRNYDVIQK